VDTKKLLERGYRSISVESFAELIEVLVPMIRADGVPEPPRGYNSEHLKAFLAKKEIFLPSFYDKLFSLDQPEVVVTYMWLATTLRELLAILRKTFAGRNGTVWVDVLFNDQRSPQVRPHPGARRLRRTRGAAALEEASLRAGLRMDRSDSIVRLGVSEARSSETSVLKLGFASPGRAGGERASSAVGPASPGKCARLAGGSVPAPAPWVCAVGFARAAGRLGVRTLPRP
jgi:hypothetical protein